MKALVTGSSGFIGTHLVRELQSQGYEVRTMDIREDILNQDICNFKNCMRKCDGMDVVFHLAAVGSVARSISMPLDTMESNCAGTANILEAARLRGVPRFVFSSSSSVYGMMSPYASSKLYGESLCKNYHDIFGMKTIALRYFNVYGHGQSGDTEYAAVIPKFIKARGLGVAPVIYGDGMQTRDFTHVSDVVNATILSSRYDKAFGNHMNISYGKGIPINYLFGLIFKGTSIRPIYAKARKGDVIHSCSPDVDEQKKIGVAPIRERVGIEEGIEDLIKSTEWGRYSITYTTGWGKNAVNDSKRV